MAAHVLGRAQLVAYRRALWPTEELAAVVIRQLNAAHPRRLAFWHPGNR